MSCDWNPLTGPSPTNDARHRDVRISDAAEFRDGFFLREISDRSVPFHGIRTHTAFGDLKEDHP